MSSTATASPEERISRFIRESLVSPEQLNDSRHEESTVEELSTGITVHAHGDFGHADR